MRKPQLSSRYFIFLTLCLTILLASWEANRSTAAFAAGDIPQDAIRLRILANSDTAEDQWIKHKIRDAVVEQMNGWVAGPQTVDEARAAIREHLPELQQLSDDLLKKYGYEYRSQVELGVVPFPTKMYGDKVYPAGNYEALRISLGKAEGQNWWCVLFPPLCFVDAVTNEAVAAKAEPEDKQVKNTKAGAKADTANVGARVDAEGGTRAELKAEEAQKTAGHEKLQKTSADSKQVGARPVALAKAGGDQMMEAAPVTAAQTQQEGKTEVKFFIWEMLKKLFSLLFK